MKGGGKSIAILERAVQARRNANDGTFCHTFPPHRMNAIFVEQHVLYALRVLIDMHAFQAKTGDCAVSRRIVGGGRRFRHSADLDEITSIDKDGEQLLPMTIRDGAKFVATGH